MLAVPWSRKERYVWQQEAIDYEQSVYFPKFKCGKNRKAREWLICIIETLWLTGYSDDIEIAMIARDDNLKD